MRIRGGALDRGRAFGVLIAATTVACVGFGVGWTSPVRAQGFLEALFGGLSGPSSQRNVLRDRPQSSAPTSSSVYGPFAAPPAARTGRRPFAARYKTVCVRVCDGYFFPLSFATPRSRFADDEAVCSARCPGQGRLFSMSTPNGRIEDAVDPHGGRYADLDTAFKYRTTFVAGCGCRPDPWSRAERLRHAMYASAEENGAEPGGAEGLIVAGKYPGPVKSTASGTVAPDGQPAKPGSDGPETPPIGSPAEDGPAGPSAGSPAGGGFGPLGSVSPAVTIEPTGARPARSSLRQDRSSAPRRDRTVRIKQAASTPFGLGGGSSGKLRWPGD